MPTSGFWLGFCTGCRALRSPRNSPLSPNPFPDSPALKAGSLLNPLQFDLNGFLLRDCRCGHGLLETSMLDGKAAPPDPRPVEALHHRRLFCLVLNSTLSYGLASALGIVIGDLLP